MIPVLFWYGVRFFTTQHAEIITALVQMDFDKANEAAASLEESVVNEWLGSCAPQSFKKRQKTLLKRSLELLRNTDAEEDEEGLDDGIPVSRETNFPYQLAGQIVRGLGRKAMLDRSRIRGLQSLLKTEIQNQGKDLDTSMHRHLTDLLRRSVDSYLNSVRSLVHIGELAVRRMADNRDSMTLYGEIVQSLVSAYKEPGEVLPIRTDTLRPKRYAESLSSQVVSVPSSDSIIASPPKDVMDIIRCLFARDMVDLERSGCGYGDVIVLLKQRISWLDPLLFFHSFNLPEATRADEDGSVAASIRDEVRSAAIIFAPHCWGNN